MAQRIFSYAMVCAVFGLAIVGGFPLERSSPTILPTSVTPSVSRLLATTLDPSQDRSTAKPGVQTTVADGDGQRSNTDNTNHGSSPASDSDAYTTHAGIDTTATSTDTTATSTDIAATSTGTAATSTGTAATSTGTTATSTDTAATSTASDTDAYTTHAGIDTTATSTDTTVTSTDAAATSTDTAATSTDTAATSTTTTTSTDTAATSTDITATSTDTAATSTDTAATSTGTTATSTGTTATSTKSAEEETGPTDAVTISTPTPSPKPETQHIFEPCGAPLIVSENSIPQDRLPNIVANIKELSDAAVEILDHIAKERIADLSTSMVLKNIQASQLFRVHTYENTVSELEESLARPNDTLKSLLLNQLRYSVYVQHVVANEQYLHYSDSLLPNLRTLNDRLMRSFSCSLAQYALTVPEPVTIDAFIRDDVNTIAYRLPDAKMFATYEAFIIFNSLKANFLSFALRFLEHYIQGF